MITKAAILINGVVCSIQKPFRHADIRKRLKKDDNPDDIYYEGFITDSAVEYLQFLDRRDAMLHAKHCEQVLQSCTDTELNTEHLW